jgi:hypothetical protein
MHNHRQRNRPARSADRPRRHSVGPGQRHDRPWIAVESMSAGDAGGSRPPDVRIGECDQCGCADREQEWIILRSAVAEDDSVRARGDVDGDERRRHHPGGLPSAVHGRACAFGHRPRLVAGHRDALRLEQVADEMLVDVAAVEVGGADRGRAGGPPKSVQ